MAALFRAALAAAPAEREGLVAAALRAAARGSFAPEVARAALAAVAERPHLASGLACLATLTRVLGDGRAAAALLEANPAVWNQLEVMARSAPLAEAVVRALAADPTKLLAGPARLEAARRALEAAARRGRRLLDRALEPADLERFIGRALEAAAARVGDSIDATNLPGFVGRAVEEFLRLAPKGAKVDALLARCLKEVQ
jgi:hypothetical protein